MSVRGLLLSSLLQVSLTELWQTAWFYRCFFQKIFGILLPYGSLILIPDPFFFILITLAWSHQPVVHYVVSTLAKLHIVWACSVWVTWFSDGQGHVRMAVVRGGGPGAGAGCCVHSCSGTCCRLPFQDMPRHFFHKFVPLSGLKTVGTWFTYIFLQVLLSCI